MDKIEFQITLEQIAKIGSELTLVKSEITDKYAEISENILISDFLDERVDFFVCQSFTSAQKKILTSIREKRFKDVLINYYFKEGHNIFNEKFKRGVFYQILNKIRIPYACVNGHTKFFKFLSSSQYRSDLIPETPESIEFKKNLNILEFTDRKGESVTVCYSCLAEKMVHIKKSSTIYPTEPNVLSRADFIQFSEILKSWSLKPDVSNIRISTYHFSPNLDNSISDKIKWLFEKGIIGSVNNWELVFKNLIVSFPVHPQILCLPDSKEHFISILVEDSWSQIKEHLNVLFKTNDISFSLDLEQEIKDKLRFTPAAILTLKLFLIEKDTPWALSTMIKAKAINYIKRKTWRLFCEEGKDFDPIKYLSYTELNDNIYKLLMATVPTLDSTLYKTLSPVELSNLATSLKGS